ncbi:unnamed protein product [Urochloa humidicola]
MEAIVAEPIEEGQDPNTATEAVAEVLPSSKFLQNAGLEIAAPKKSVAATVRARVQELQAEVRAEKGDSAALRCQIESQLNALECLKSKIEEIKVAKQKQQELDNLKKKGEETNSLHRFLHLKG